MKTFIDVLVVFNDLFVLPLMVAAVALCFLKGRRRAGWAGLAVLAIGGTAVLPLFRFLREHDAEGWLLVAFLVGLVAVVAVGREALKAPIDTSWWARRHGGGQTTPPVR